MSDLKRCPFCGGEAQITENYAGQTRIVCTNYSGGCAVGQLFWYDFREDAIEAWNRRTSDG